jgi:hypothetical protein
MYILIRGFEYKIQIAKNSIKINIKKGGCLLFSLKKVLADHGINLITR